MGKSYSLDIRERVVAMIESGQSCRASARYFGIGDSTAIRLMQCHRQMGTTASNQKASTAFGQFDVQKINGAATEAD